MQEDNRVITTKKSKGKLTLLRGNGKRVILIYGYEANGIVMS